MLQMMNNLEVYYTNPGSVEVTNMAGFTSSFVVSYTLNGQEVNKDSGIFSLFFSRKIDIPSNATNIHILVIAYTGVERSIPIYNNNWDSPGILKLTLYGTVFSPQAEVLSDSNPPKYSLSVKNNAGLVANCILLYSYNSKNYTINVGDFTLGMTVRIGIPQSAQNISVLVISNLSSALPDFETIFNKDYGNARNISLLISGTTGSPKVSELSSSSGGNTEDPKKPLIKVLKSPNKSQVVLGEKVTFRITISNVSGSTAKMLIFSEYIPPEAIFVENSFILNESPIKSDIFPTSSLILNDLNVSESITLSYSIIFNKIPSENPIEGKPIINYNYIDSNGKTTSTSIVGTTIPLNIINNVDIPTSVPCICCCCCKLINLTFSQYEQYLSYMRSMGYI